METIRLTKKNLNPRPDIGKDWYEWEGCDTKAHIEIDEGINLCVTGYTNTNGGRIYTDGGNIKTYGRIYTNGGNIETGGGNIEIDGGCIYTNNGHIKTSGGFIG
jgi:hypothetical protein